MCRGRFGSLPSLRSLVIGTGGKSEHGYDAPMGQPTDVDDLDEIGDLESYVNASQSVLVALTKGYFASRNCLKELNCALHERKPLILVHETDEAKGGLPLEDMEEERSRRSCAGGQDAVSRSGRRAPHAAPCGAARAPSRTQRATRHDVTCAVVVDRPACAPCCRPRSSSRR